MPHDKCKHTFTVKGVSGVCGLIAGSPAVCRIDTRDRLYLCEKYASIDDASINFNLAPTRPFLPPSKT